MRPEMPYLAAGAVTLIGATVKEGNWPKDAARSLIGTVALVVLASASTDTPLAPLVRAIGLLLFLVAAMAAIRLNQKK